MFSFTESPCIYDRRPALDAFAPFGMVPGSKRRRVNHQPLHATNLRPVQSSLKCDVVEKDDEYVLSVYKRLDEDVLGNAIYRHLQKLREERAPSYHVVRDFFGNEYYVEDRCDEDVFMREAMATLDLPSIQHQVAKQCFKDYEITLRHRGDELVVVSRRDNFYKEFALGVEFEDVCVNGFEMVSDTIAALRVGIKKPALRTVLPINLRIVGGNAERNTPVIAAGEADLSGCFEKQEQVIQRAQELARRKQKIHEAKELARREQAMQEAQELVRREKAIQEALSKHQAKQKAEEEATRLKAEEEAAKEEASNRTAQRNRKKVIAEKKAFLLEQKRKRREEQEDKNACVAASRTQTPSPQSSPVVININIDTHARNRDPDHAQSHSPVLEDIDDEEVQRYHRSLYDSPRGSSIIDNV
ncbi:LAME_0H19306g1_1 [Lachancea meyersii CBS 8951]|uniref:LAME_0H19306g1_1 n=1 Tax=Lachancea meyersii CBS 8951 TaxID=1266667 RepID=A0A1G4KJ84_9SACH|nr:LAME_0H19306g1_1 [Lachancea meyersii CBS 8951]